MLERFTEKARRVVFFARYEASQDGHPVIESVHLLVGLHRENQALLSDLGVMPDALAHIHQTLIPEKRPKIATAVELPLSSEAKSILRRAADEATALGHKHVGTEHLLLAVILESSQLREYLSHEGLTEGDLHARISRFVDAPSREIPTPAVQEVNLTQSKLGARAGIGYDLHRLETGRKLMIGGVEIPFDKGSVGHSDGDVLAHAICDALLGAAGLGDIGTHFPDTDPKWKGASSLVFLDHVHALLQKQSFSVTHIDAVVICERPKLGPHFPAMSAALASALRIEPSQINLKAKTNEGVDAIGRGEAIAAHVVATLKRGAMFSVDLDSRRRPHRLRGH